MATSARASRGTCCREDDGGARCDGATDERGFALVAVLVVMMLLLGDRRGPPHRRHRARRALRGAHARATAGFYAAEAGINRGMGDYRNIFLSYEHPDGADFDAQQLHARTAHGEATSCSRRCAR